MCIPCFVSIGRGVRELHGHLCSYCNVWPEALYYKNYIVYQIIGRAGASPPSLTTGTNIYIFASSVSPDTISLLNVSKRFYLGVHTVRNIARTVSYRLQTLGPSSARVDTALRALVNEVHVGLYVVS